MTPSFFDTDSKKSLFFYLEYLWQEDKISYHTELGKVTFYHSLTAVQQNNVQKGLFKIFIPSTSFKKVIQNHQRHRKLTAEVTIHPGTDSEGSAIDQAYIKIDQLPITIQVKRQEDKNQIQFSCRCNIHVITRSYRLIILKLQMK